MKKILVTGSNGYIGRHVVKYLLDEGYHVIAADISNDCVDERAEKINASIFDNTDDAFVKFGSADLCIHLAWRNGFVHNAETHISDLPAHYAFLKSMIDGGLKKLSVMGTMHEIGYWEGAIDENTPCNPQSLYGISKNALRQSVIQMAKDKNVDLYWLRAYYILGDDAKNHSIFSKILEMNSKGAKTFPFTSGKNLYDFISVEQLAKYIVLASTQDSVTGIINVCTGNPVSLGQKVEEFIDKNELSIKLDYGAFPDRPYDSPGVWGDATKINQILSNGENK